MQYYSFVIVALVFGLGCVSAPEQSDDATDAAAVAPTVDLRGVVVGLVGNGILLQNHSREDLTEVDIVINERAGGGYRFRVSEIKSNTTQTYLTQVFRDASGARFDPQAVKVDGFSVYAGTPRGRGSWQGQYRQ